nr:glutathione binding-like protein [Pseudoalteromonas sp. MMG010]
MIYLVQKYAPNSQWLPCDAKSAANVQRWLSIAADNIYSGPCAARLVTLFGAPLDHAGAVKKSHDLLIMMEAYLENRQWLVQTHITIADVAAYSYIAHAPEGGVSLKAYPNIRAWIGRIEQLPNFVPMIPSAHVELS